ncbi:succinate dehydrogenase, cytochrome b556 subunit [Pseudoduganella sp. RAF53_2]|jgi:succinate dehydrogenase / fumarate reductase cytochrome b subunit|uniref:succinate dehydrogenase, cytochrome b556 subunit n=1 Tax=unclassified Pseudoduganella TaxID=2637179 RepID=UPI003F99F15E
MSEAVREAPKKERPEFRNIHVTDLMGYRLPWAGKISILHRISGGLLFLLLPVVLYLLEQSLRSEYSFAHFQEIASTPIVKLIFLALVWGYTQHFCAGIRHLIMDTHTLADKESAQKTAVTGIVITVIVTVLVALKLFGVF